MSNITNNSSFTHDENYHKNELEQQLQQQAKNVAKGTQETSVISSSILLLLSLLVINELSISFLNKLKSKNMKYVKYIPSTSITTLVGIIAGIGMNYSGYQDQLDSLKSGFSQIFLIVLLPPILFEAALNMEQKHFFKNFGSICMYAIFGTIIATISTAVLVWLVGFIGIATKLDIIPAFAFGSFISSTDPVAVLAIFKQVNSDQTLYSLIFGESILNDAVALILFETFAKIYALHNQTKNLVWVVSSAFIQNFLISLAIGFIIGLICALILKKNEKDNDINPSDIQQLDNKEATIMLLIPWVSYLIAEGFNMSGIVSLVFCGISMAKYAIPNLSVSGNKTVRRLYLTMAYNFETLVFLFIGIGFFGFDLAYSDMGPSLFIFSFFIINFSRFLNIALITKFVNRYRFQSKINKRQQFVLWFSGFRGAMAYALSIQASQIFIEYNIGNIMLTITMLYSTINIFLYGGFLVPLLEKCESENNNLWKQLFQEKDNNIQIECQQPDEQSCINQIRQWINKFDNDYLIYYLVQNRKLGSDNQNNLSLNQTLIKNDSNQELAYTKNQQIQKIRINDNRVLEDKNQLVQMQFEQIESLNGQNSPDNLRPESHDQSIEYQSEHININDQQKE